MIKIERVSYHGWNNVYRISNGCIELRVLADVGPRVLWYGLCDSENQFYEVADDFGKAGGQQFRLYGGHRLWIAPETERTMYGDNHPVVTSHKSRGIKLTAPIENSSLQRSLEIEVGEAGTDVRLVHTITNHGPLTEAAPWGISVMKPEGIGIIPLPPRAAHDPSHLLPNARIAIWSYTDFSDPRWLLGQTSIQLKQQTQVSKRFPEQKVAVLNLKGWIAYCNHEHLFVKWAEWPTEAQYPDLGCNLEMFTNSQLCELETLGPMQQIGTGATAVHVEHWRLITGVPQGTGDAWFREVIKSNLNSVEICA